MESNQNQLQEYLQNIGSPDEKQRELIFEYWHKQRINNLFSKEQYKQLLLLSQDLINYHIDSPEQEGVLTRSYSLLLIDCLLQADNEYDVYSESDMEQLVSSIINYMKLEQDWRGYESELGYIHTLAHLSDCIYSLLDSDKYSRNQKENILKQYLYLVDNTTCDFMYLEDERVARALSKIFSNQILNDWICSRVEYIQSLNLPRNKRILVVNKNRLILKAMLIFNKESSYIRNELERLY